MSTTELATNHQRNGGAGSADMTLSDQVVLSGAGLLTQSLERTRSNADAILDVVDELVLDTLSLLEDWNAMSGQFVSQLSTLAAKPIPVARKAYTKGSETLRNVIAAA